jgi:hypothetical protein
MFKVLNIISRGFTCFFKKKNKCGYHLDVLREKKPNLVLAPGTYMGARRIMEQNSLRPDLRDERQEVAHSGIYKDHERPWRLQVHI